MSKRTLIWLAGGAAVVAVGYYLLKPSSSISTQTYALNAKPQIYGVEGEGTSATNPITSGMGESAGGFC